MKDVREIPARRRRLHAADRETTRALLVDAAIRVFAARGYARATVDQIATEAGASRATFYLHFHNKADLLPELLDRAAGEFAEPYVRLAPALRDGDRALIREWILESMHRWARIEDLMRPIHEAADADAQTHREIFPDDVPGLAAMSQVLLDADLARDAQHAEAYAIILYSPLLHLFRKHLRGEPYDHELNAATLATAWADIVAGARKHQ